jgi:hypothetical protein
MRFSLLFVLLVGCGQDICIRNSDCIAGEMCSAQGVCAVTSSDGGVEDAAVESDAAVDAGIDAAEESAAFRVCPKGRPRDTETSKRKSYETEDCNGDGSSDE